MQQFQVVRSAFSEARVQTCAGQSVGSDEVKVSIERFAFTANNVTYAAAGDLLGYWQFFPPLGKDVDRWGVIPVWGCASVAESRVNGLVEGERLFGYFPPASELILRPERVSATQFFDGAAHRASLPSGYNRYRRVAAEPGYDQSMDNERMLLWPLYVTAFCLWDSLVMHDWYGAQQIVVLSASSKTSIGLAYALSDDAQSPVTVGLTSTRHCSIVEGLSLYDAVATYDDVRAIDTSLPTVIVDMSGNTQVLGALHQGLGDQLRKCINVGITHWEDTAAHPDINAERSEMFFAPAHIASRAKEWGAEVFDGKSTDFVRQAIERSRHWLTLKESSGLPSLLDQYPAICSGQTAPNEGLIFTL